MPFRHSSGRWRWLPFGHTRAKGRSCWLPLGYSGKRGWGYRLQTGGAYCRQHALGGTSCMVVTWPGALRFPLNRLLHFLVDASWHCGAKVHQFHIERCCQNVFLQHGRLHRVSYPIRPVSKSSTANGGEIHSHPFLSVLRKQSCCKQSRFKSRIEHCSGKWFPISCRRRLGIGNRQCRCKDLTHPVRPSDYLGVPMHANFDKGADIVNKSAAILSHLCLQPLFQRRKAAL
mmetsp:Transcript_16320/g.37660  ORF Transcript_16320/g.37660 Transcript_16320/m.37660 type:complete len:230 (-) Transcript_16320:271-960(-)